MSRRSCEGLQLYVDHLAQIEMSIRKSEELKVKGSKRSGWKKVTTSGSVQNR